MEVLARELEAVSIIEAAAHRIGLEDVQEQLVVQAGRMIHQRPTDTLPLGLGMHEYCANLIADQRQEADHLPIFLKYPGVRPLQPDGANVFTLRGQEFF